MADTSKEISLESIVTTALTIPGVKVTRNSFLSECFKNEDVNIHDILDYGPVAAGCSRETLRKMADHLVVKRTQNTSALSFLAGMPGGLAMGATIPADVLQFFGTALRLAQELSYLYGAEDLWRNGEIDSSLVNNQMIMYCGVMFGVSGAANGVRLLSTQLAKTAAKKIPQKALTKTFWYPIVKQICKAIGIKVTKSTVAAGVAKAIPVVGGVVSGGITYASMLPMGRRLAETLDEANFDYTQAELENDIAVVESVTENNEIESSENKSFIKGGLNEVAKGVKGIEKGVTGLFSKVQKSIPQNTEQPQVPAEDDVFVKIEKLSRLHELGAITQEEFETKKAELLSEI